MEEDLIEDDRINHDRLSRILRWCANCDPLAQNAIESPPGQCSCGHNLLVLTNWSGRNFNLGQYKGSKIRYSTPVALVTGNQGEFPSLLLLTTEEAGDLLKLDDDIR